MSDSSDEALIRQLQRGERGALDVLMERYQKKLARFIQFYTGDESIVDDLVQETFVKVYFNAASFRFESQFNTWLFKIAINKCKDHARKGGRRFISIDDETLANSAALISQDTSPEDAVAAKHTLEKLQDEIHRLPEKLKAALIAFAVEEQSQEECAKLLGTNAKTVETRVYRARKILADRMLKPINKR